MVQHRFQRPKIEPSFSARTNEKILVPEVRVIGPDGAQLGIMPTARAVQMAREQGLDLVEVAPTAQPPVARILSYDKYRYQQNKLAQAQKKNTKKIDVKSVRLSIRTGQHDLEVKARMADKFLKDGDKVKIDLVMRGREKANIPFALERVDAFLKMLQHPHVIETPAKRLGGMINAIVGPKK